MELEDVMTFGEACQIWELCETTLRTANLRGKFVLGVDVRKSKGTWLITRQAMERIYGAQPQKEE